MENYALACLAVSLCRTWSDIRLLDDEQTRNVRRGINLPALINKEKFDKTWITEAQHFVAILLADKAPLATRIAAGTLSYNIALRTLRLADQTRARNHDARSGPRSCSCASGYGACCGEFDPHPARSSCRILGQNSPASDREPGFPASSASPPPHLHSLRHFASIAPETRRTDEADVHAVYRTGPDTGRTGREPDRKPQAVNAPPRPAPTPFILCADDYGFSPGVSSAIRDLIDRGRLSATSCMTMSPFWPDHASWLKPYADQVDVGLHLTLTDHRPLGPMPRTAPAGRLPPLPVLMRKALHLSVGSGLRSIRN